MRVVTARVVANAANTAARTSPSRVVVGANAAARRPVRGSHGKPLRRATRSASASVGRRRRRSVANGNAARRRGGARETSYDRGGSGSGGGRGGDGDGGGRGEGDEDEGEDDANGGRLGTFALGVGASVLAATFASAPEANAGALSGTRRRSSSKLTDAATSLLYGFVVFYGVKLALKRLFAPVLLFVSTTHLLYKMRTLRVSPFMLYEDLIKPYMPLEYQKNLEDFSAKAMKSKVVDKKLLHDGWWDRQERRFWACAHRLLPACNSSIGERAFVIGILLAGLA